MLKYRILFSIMVVLFTAIIPVYSQIGINTENPQYLLHISGKASTTQLLNDVVIDSDGNVGLGAAPSPSVKLEINGSLFLAGKNLKADMRLVSDANGYAKWESIDNLLKPIEAVVKGVLYGDPTGLTDPNSADPARIYYWSSASSLNKWTNITRTSIQVTAGTWLVYSSIGMTAKSTPTTGNNFFWMQLRDKSTGSVLDTVGNLHEFTGGGWSKPQIMKLIKFTQNAELEIWVACEGEGSVNNRYGGSHFCAIKIL